MNFCPQCGSKVDSNARYCSQCGGKLQKKPEEHLEPAIPPMYSRAQGDIGPPEYSANWIYDRVYAQASGEWKAFSGHFNFNVPELELFPLLLAPVSELNEKDRDAAIRVHNWTVKAIRFLVNKSIEDGAPAVLALERDNLTIPKDWDSHYLNIHKAQLPILLYAALQHAFRGNPFAGETNEWSNKLSWLGGVRVKPGRALAGAVAVGAAASWLMG